MLRPSDIHGMEYHCRDYVVDVSAVCIAVIRTLEKI